jgi:hypothetical protein
MTRTLSNIVALALLTAAFGCSSGEASDRLLDEGASGEGASPGTLYDHQDTQPASQVSPEDRQAEQDQVGSPEVYARLHACGKLTVHSLGRILTTRGVSPAGPAFALFTSGATAFGAANYGSRSPETIIASTANLTKEFDVLVAAAPEMLANVGAPDGACPGVKLYDAGSFTKDGLACIMGKPAKPEHVFLANQAVKDAVAAGISEEDGKSIAVASLLQAAHTCE